MSFMFWWLLLNRKLFFIFIFFYRITVFYVTDKIQSESFVTSAFIWSIANEETPRGENVYEQFSFVHKHDAIVDKRIIDIS